MPFPAAWPPRIPSGVRSIRFYTGGTCTNAFADNAFLFIDGAGANPFTPVPPVPMSAGTTANPLTPGGTGAPTIASGMVGGPAPMIWSGNIRVCNDGSVPLEFTFNGTDVHGVVRGGEIFMYRNRYEAGIAVRGVGGTPAFRVEAW